MGRWLKTAFIVILMIIGIILYARFIGTMGFDTKEYTIYDKNIPSGFDGIKIVHFSDLHYNRAITSDKVDKIIKEININTNPTKLIIIPFALSRLIKYTSCANTCTPNPPIKNNKANKPRTTIIYISPFIFSELLLNLYYNIHQC